MTILYIYISMIILYIKRKVTMTIFTETFIPYEYESRYDALRHVESRCQGLEKSLRLTEKDSEHLTIRCPLSGDYLEIVGSIDELEWLHKELKKRNLYRS